MKAKKLLALLLAVVMILATASACAGTTDNSDSSTPESSSEADESSTADDSSEVEDEKYPLLNMESELPITKEEQTITFLSSYDSAVPVDFENGQNFWQYINSVSNVKPEFTLVANEAWNEQVNIILAGSDLPDVFFHNLGASDTYKYAVKEQIFIPLNEYLDDAELTPNINKIFTDCPALKAASTLPDGNIYGFGYYNTEYYVLAPGDKAQWIIEYADNAGVDYKSIETLDDLYNALVQLKGSDFNGNGVDDEIPLAYYSGNNGNSWMALVEYFLNAYGFTGSSRVAVDTREGKAYYAPLTEEYKAVVEFLAKLYAEGLLDPETFTQSEAEFQAKGQNGRYAFYSYYNIDACVPTSVVEEVTAGNFENGVARWWQKPLVDDTANTPVTDGSYRVGPNRFFITKACEHPEIVARWADYVSSPIGSMLFRNGPEYQSEYDIIGNGWDYDEELTMINTDAMLERSNQEGGWYMWLDVVNFAMGSVGMIGTDEQLGFRDIYPDYGSKGDAGWLNGYVEQVEEYETPGYPTVYYSDEQTEFINTYVTDLNTYVDQMVAKFITGEESIDNWDSFIDGMNNLKAAEYNDIISSLYDNYLANA